MSLDFIENMIIPIVLVACLIVGYIVKKWIKDIDNKYIPTIVAVLGAVLGCIVGRAISVETIVAGAVTGLASTGLHQVFVQYIEGGQIKSMTENEVNEMGQGDMDE